MHLVILYTCHIPIRLHKNATFLSNCATICTCIASTQFHVACISKIYFAYVISSLFPRSHFYLHFILHCVIIVFLLDGGGYCVWGGGGGVVCSVTIT